MNDIKCLLGMHRLELLKEQPLTDPRGNTIGLTIISKCKHCGKIRTTYIRTVNE